MSKQARLSIDDIEACLVHLELVVGSSARLGSALAGGLFPTTEDRCHALEDFLEWSDVAGRMASVRRVLSDAYDRTATEARIKRFEDRLEREPRWNFIIASQRIAMRVNKRKMKPTKASARNLAATVTTAAANKVPKRGRAPKRSTRPAQGGLI